MDNAEILGTFFAFVFTGKVFYWVFTSGDRKWGGDATHVSRQLSIPKLDTRP